MRFDAVRVYGGLRVNDSDGDLAMVMAKLLHLIGLLAGLGFGLANIVILLRLPQASPEARTALQALQKLNGRIAFGGIILLWISGIWLYYAAYAGVVLRWPFYVKIAVAVVLTIAAAYAQWMVLRADISGKAPSPAMMRTLGMTVPFLAVVTVVLAIAAFN